MEKIAFLLGTSDASNNNSKWKSNSNSNYNGTKQFSSPPKYFSFLASYENIALHQAYYWEKLGDTGIQFAM